MRSDGWSITDAGWPAWGGITIEVLGIGEPIMFTTTDFIDSALPHIRVPVSGKINVELNQNGRTVKDIRTLSVSSP